MSSDLAFLKSKPTAVEINGQLMNFYPLSLGALHRLKGLAKPISSALSALFAKTDTDVGRNYEDFVNKDAEMASTKTRTEPISVDLARLRSDQRERALAQLLDCLTDPVVHRDILLIITDSARDSFPAVMSDVMIKDVMTKMDVATMVAMFQGVVKANGSAFGPLVGKVSEALKNSISAPSPLQQSPDSQSSSRSQSDAEAVPLPTLVKKPRTMGEALSNES